MICSLMVVVYVLSFHVSCSQYPLMTFVIIISEIFLRLSSPEIPCTFLFMAVRVYGQLFPGLVVVHVPCPGENESSSDFINFHDGQLWFSGGRLQSSSCSTLIDFAIGSGWFQVAVLSMCGRFLR